MPQHRLRIDPRRVEDAFIVAPPGGLERIALRRIGMARSRAGDERLLVPMQGTERGQDRPDEIAEAGDEEWPRRFQDVMLRLEPGDVALGPIRVLGFAEAQESVHLVD